ncbi:MAG: hypothetical protein MJ131_00550 [Lachnospiraceae bacterium]|nr:hypothetical protein [Lachnospiraceae bacterium]
MRKRILNYRYYMEELLERLEKKGGSEAELNKLKTEHLTQLAFFQHERLIHLIVTVLFALIEFIALYMFLTLGTIGTLLLTAAIMILLIPYIRHYYLLENEVQRMYVQYDRLQKLIDAAEGRELSSFSMGK